MTRRARLLREVERVVHVPGGVIAGGHRRDSEAFFHGAQPAFPRIGIVIDISLARVRADHQSRNANAEPYRSGLGGGT